MREETATEAKRHDGRNAEPVRIEFRVYDPGEWSPAEDGGATDGNVDSAGSEARRSLESHVLHMGGIVEQQMPALCAGEDVTIVAVLTYVGGAAGMLQLLEYGRRLLHFLRARNRRNVWTNASADIEALKAVAMFIASERGPPFSSEILAVRVHRLEDGERAGEARPVRSDHAEAFVGTYEFDVPNLANGEVRVVRLSSKGELVAYMVRPPP